VQESISSHSPYECVPALRRGAGTDHAQTDGTKECCRVLEEPEAAGELIFEYRANT